MLTLPLCPKPGALLLTIFRIEFRHVRRQADLMSEQEYRMRECVHRVRGAAGEYYCGSSYVKHLQRLRTTAFASL